MTEPQHHVLIPQTDSLRTWDARTGELVEQWSQPGIEWDHIAVARRGNAVAAGDQFGRLHVWPGRPRAAGKLLDPRIGESITWLSWSADGRYLAAGNSQAADGIRIFDMATGLPLELLKNVQSDVAALSARGNVLAIERDNQLEIWDVVRRRRIHTLSGHTSSIDALALSGDERFMASAGKDRRVLVWDLASGRLEHALEGHAGYVGDVCFAPDGRTLLSTGRDGRLNFWHMATGQLLLTWTNPYPGFRLQLSGHDGRLLVWCGGDRFLGFDVR